MFTGDDSPIANLTLGVMGGVAQFERELIRERQKEGIELAKRAGIYKGRKRTLTADRAAELSVRFAAGERKAGLAREFGITRTTLYRYIDREKEPAARARGGK